MSFRSASRSPMESPSFQPCLPSRFTMRSTPFSRSPSARALAFLLTACTGIFACSQSPAPGSSSTTGGDGGQHTHRCHDVYIVGDPCDPCLHDNCCALVSQCDETCLDCLRGGLPCDVIANNIFKCADAKCPVACSGHPSTTSGSGGAGGAMTTVGSGGAGGT